MRDPLAPFGGCFCCTPSPASSRTRPKTEDPGPESHSGCGFGPERSGNALGSPVPGRAALAREDEGEAEQRRRVREGSATFSRCRPGFGKAEDREPVTTAVATLAVARHRRAGGCCRRTPTRPGGYWTPACAGVTTVEVAMRSRPAPAEGANGSRFCAALDRDDPREGGTALHPLCRHPGQGAAGEPGPIGCQSGCEGARAAPCTPRCATKKGAARLRRPSVSQRCGAGCPVAARKAGPLRRYSAAARKDGAAARIAPSTWLSNLAKLLTNMSTSLAACAS